jgi:CRISPR system Cascade subunit CasA
MKSEFNLIDEPWIPCIDLKGEKVEYGILDTLLRAHNLREIHDDSPLVTVAIHRLLLAILYRVFEGPSDTNQWKGLYQYGSFSRDGALNNYFGKWHHRFFLFDESCPFMQVGKLDLNKYKINGAVKEYNTDALMRLAKEAPNKKGRVLFDHQMATELLDYEPNEIARMLISAQSYAGTGIARSGKVGKQKIEPKPCRFAPCVKGICLWLQGNNLFQTLLVNLIPSQFIANDLPPWEEHDIVQAAVLSWRKEVKFTGPVQRFAPQSRLIRIINRHTMFFTNGLRTTTDTDIDDPMKTYYREPVTKAYQPLEMSKDKASWRDAHTLFSLGASNVKTAASLNFFAQLEKGGVLDGGAGFRANVVGLATKQDKVLLWRHERLPVPVELLNNDSLVERLRTLVEEAESLNSELCKRAYMIARFYLLPGADQRQLSKHEKEEVRKIAEVIDPCPVYWLRLENYFLSLLENLPEDWDEAKDDWKPDDNQRATSDWRKCLKDEAEQSLKESIRFLGTTVRAIQAVARVRIDFNDVDLKSQQQNRTQKKGRGGKRK